MPVRYDYRTSKINKTEVTPQGFLRAPANLTRTGVLLYKTGDGRTIRELRPEEEVFKQDSLDTLSLAPVTIKHGGGLINPDNVRKFSVGVASEQVSKTEQYVTGDLIIQDREAIKQVQSKELVDISPGYTCTIDPTPGTYNGERYDQVQRNIRYNHITLTAPGKGRSGPGVSIRLDSDDAILTDTEEPKTQEPLKKESSMKKIRITLDGIEHEIEISESLAATFESQIKKLQTRQDSISALEGEKEALEQQLKETKEKLEEATRADTIDALVTERMDTIEKGRKIAPKLETKGLTTSEIKKAALKEAGFDSARLDSADAAFIDGAFLAYQPKEVKSTVTIPTPEPIRLDSKETDNRTPRQKMLDRHYTAWSKEV